MEGTPKRPSNQELLLNEILQEALALPLSGEVANYIPALASVNPNQCGIAVANLDGQVHVAGDADVPFSIQSVSKVFGLALAMLRMGDDLWQRVHMEPSGQAFNSIVQLEWEHGIPRNPFINAGAIVVADTLVSHYSASKNALMSFVRGLADRPEIAVNQDVFLSEKQHGSRNAALAYLMKSFGNIEADVEDALDHYFYQCSIEMSCRDVARSLSFLANRGVQPHSGDTIVSRRDAHRINAIMQTSGMYDQSGEFAFEVGLPAKSGVGGGIVAIVPNYGVICAWSPRLNQYGNSCMGMYMITRLAEKLGLSVY
ncbi:glutaminase [Aliidiomarina maris]|uniref:Glutaminase n=1 Tax=Aliidiomarina maris TaxID=531312 RepID=A0A327X1X7_9GAMM|nr:glutaminase [Aliidiomarina maris]MCL5049355.1 glutaminase [Bacillota bacterium]RAJ99218.1 L-glutaminase [Aliidiomarina maris]RUO27637.1 glutaminase [Aliidiomarina maris]